MNGKILTAILGINNSVRIWNATVSHVNNNFISKKQCLYIEITESYIYTAHDGFCLERLLHTIKP